MELARDLAAFVVVRSGEGGRQGQWSARKSQLLVHRYEEQGGGYRGDQNEDEARSLRAWSEQEWQTRGGGGDAERDGRMHRYLPRDVWARLSPAERRRAERSKARADREGKRRAAWPAAVRRAMRAVEREAEPTKRELYERARQLDVAGRSRMDKAALARAVASAERKR